MLDYDIISQQTTEYPKAEIHCNINYKFARKYLQLKNGVSKIYNPDHVEEE